MVNFNQILNNCELFGHLDRVYNSWSIGKYLSKDIKTTSSYSSVFNDYFEQIFAIE